MPKEERLKLYRNDSVDEVDTTDLENWDFRTRHITMKADRFSDEEDSSDTDFDQNNEDYKQ